jgi:hypothetical protein
MENENNELYGIPLEMAKSGVLREKINHFISCGVEFRDVWNNSIPLPKDFNKKETTDNIEKRIIRHMVRTVIDIIDYCKNDIKYDSLDIELLKHDFYNKRYEKIVFELHNILYEISKKSLEPIIKQFG